MQRSLSWFKNTDDKVSRSCLWDFPPLEKLFYYRKETQDAVNRASESDKNKELKREVACLEGSLRRRLTWARPFTYSALWNDFVRAKRKESPDSGYGGCDILVGNHLGARQYCSNTMFILSPAAVQGMVLNLISHYRLRIRSYH